jgi:ABC-2 type transport system permease protein
MTSPILTIAWREYWSRVGQVSFWLSTLSFPVVFIVIALIGGLGGQSIENLETVDLAGIDKPIAIQDDAGILTPGKLALPDKVTVLPKGNATDPTIEQVRSGAIDAFIYYPSSLLTDKQIEIYTPDKGFIGNGKYDDLAKGLIRSSAVKQIENPATIAALEDDFDTKVSAFKDGELITVSPWAIVAPIASLVIYMVLVMTSSQFMLQSVAEEKENRMIEIVLAAVRPSQLILGKLVGLSGVVLTQAASLLLSTAIPALILSTIALIALPFQWADLGLSVEQAFLALAGIVIGFVTMSSLMICVAAITPNYRDAQSFSGLFIFLSVTPSMFFALMLADPHGLLATVLTYIPLAGNLALVLRNGLHAISGWEIVFSLAVNTLYMLGSLWLAFRLFEIGALQFNQRLSFAQIRRTLLR